MTARKATKRKPAPKPAKATAAAPPPEESTLYGKHRERQAAAFRLASTSARDIGPMPPIADIERRESCRLDFDLFCTTYNPDAFYLPWASYQIEGNARIKEAVLQGALYAMAEPRGGGKTTRCRMAVLWAVAYAHRFYPITIGANDDKATDNLNAIKMFIRFLPLFAADFPEISYPAQRLKGIAQAAHGQLCCGEQTLIEWSQNRIVLPTVPPPANWPDTWLLRRDGMVPTSGSIIGATGLTAEGIRGTVVTLTTGEQRRPDLILADDPQTRESAGSPTQNAKRMQLLSADVLGMAGPDKTISGVMPCTVIEKADMVDQILDRTKHPMWRGERTKMLRTMPKNMAAWRKYFDVYVEGSLAEPPDLTDAMAYYVAHQEELEDGAEASWPERKLPGEVSAIQHAMHLWFRDPRAFMSEYQNDPEAPELLSEARQLTEADLILKLNQQKRGELPRDCNKMTAFIDVQQEVLFYMVCGWTDAFGGSIVDYGAFPAQRRVIFEASDPSPKLSDKFPAMKGPARIYAGLAELVPLLLSNSYPHADGTGAATVCQCLIDAGYETETVHDYLSRSPLRALLLASKGRGIDASSKPLNEYRKEPGDRVGHNWRIDAKTQGKGKFVSFDSNAWKTFVVEALLAAPGAAGSLYLPGKSIQEHPLLSLHLLSEYRVPTFGLGRRVEKWKMRPDKRENHWLDALVGCAVAASVAGVRFSAASAAGVTEPAPEEGRRRTSRADYDKKRQEFDAKRGFR